MTRIPAKISKGDGIDAKITISLRAVFGEIKFVGDNPNALSHFKDGAEVDIIIKPRRK